METGAPFQNFLGGGKTFLGGKISFDFVVHSWEATDAVLFLHTFLRLTKVLIKDKCVPFWEYRRAFADIIENY